MTERERHPMWRIIAFLATAAATAVLVWLLGPLFKPLLSAPVWIVFLAVGAFIAFICAFILLDRRQDRRQARRADDDDGEEWE
ncbi:MAG: hypothetical protein GY778_19390 [bacterium]|nr:hypothetical protein [bacterium]